jgi:hypothetical protein
MAIDEQTAELNSLRREIDAACADNAALQAELEAVRAAAGRLDRRLTRLNLSVKQRKGRVKPTVTTSLPHQQIRVATPLAPE